MQPAVRNVSSLEVRDSLRELGLLAEEISILEETISLYKEDERTRKALTKPDANGRATRAMLLRDWFFTVYETVKTPDSDKASMFFLRFRRPHIDAGAQTLSSDSVVFSAMSEPKLKSLISRYVTSIFPRFTASADFKEFSATIINSITDLVETPDKAYIYLAGSKIVHVPNNMEEDWRIIDLVEDGYIDSGFNNFTNALPRVFYKFFDTNPAVTKGDNDIVTVPTPTPEMVQTLKDEYDSTLFRLENKMPLDDIALKEIMDWCCQSTGRYRDIIHMASSRLKKHDFGVYFLSGTGRNGKSSCIDLIASLYGTNNMCKVPVENLGDWHNLRNFQKALVNLPDEQRMDDNNRVMDGDSVRAFRIAAGHGVENIHKMGSNESIQLVYSFSTIAPVNSMPRFPRDGQRACIERCRIIEFQNDFSASDKLAVKWGKAHFTPTFMMRFTGQVLAFANYYSSHAWVESKEMELARDKQYEDSASYIKYMRIWEKIFCGFSSHNLLKSDYDNYCRLSDLDAVQFTRDSIILQSYNVKERRRYGGRSGIQFRALVNPFRKGVCKDRVMYGGAPFIIKVGGETYDITAGRTIEKFVGEGHSIIYELEDRGLLTKLDQTELPLGDQNE